MQRSVSLRSVTSVALGWGGGGDPYPPAKPLGLEGGTPLPFPSPVPTVVGRGRRQRCHHAPFATLGSSLSPEPPTEPGRGQTTRGPPPGFCFKSWAGKSPRAGLGGAQGARVTSSRGKSSGRQITQPGRDFGEKPGVRGRGSGGAQLRFCPRPGAGGGGAGSGPAPVPGSQMMGRAGLTLQDVARRQSSCHFSRHC